MEKQKDRLHAVRGPLLLTGALALALAGLGQAQGRKPSIEQRVTTLEKLATDQAAQIAVLKAKLEAEEPVGTQGPGPGGTLVEVARHRGPAPGGGFFLREAARYREVRNRRGQTLFYAGWDADGDGDGDGSALFLAGPGGITRLMGTGDVLPDGRVMYYLLEDDDALALTESGHAYFAVVTKSSYVNPNWSQGNGVYGWDGARLFTIVGTDRNNKTSDGKFLGRVFGLRSISANRIGFEAYLLDDGGTSNLGEGNLFEYRTP